MRAAVLKKDVQREAFDVTSTSVFAYFFAGLLTLFTVAVCILLFLSMYIYQKKLHIPFQNSFLGFVCFLLFFQTIQSAAALHGYLIRLLHRKGEWK